MFPPLDATLALSPTIVTKGDSAPRTVVFLLLICGLSISRVPFILKVINPLPKRLPYRNTDGIITSNTDRFPKDVVDGLRPIYRSCTEAEMMDSRTADVRGFVGLGGVNPKESRCSAVLIDGDSFELINWDTPETLDVNAHLVPTPAVIIATGAAKQYNIVVGGRFPDQAQSSMQWCNYREGQQVHEGKIWGTGTYEWNCTALHGSKWPPLPPIDSDENVAKALAAIGTFGDQRVADKAFLYFSADITGKPNLCVEYHQINRGGTYRGIAYSVLRNSAGDWSLLASPYVTDKCTVYISRPDSHPVEITEKLKARGKGGEDAAQPLPPPISRAEVDAAMEKPWSVLPQLKPSLRHVFGSNLNAFNAHSDGTSSLSIKGNIVLFVGCSTSSKCVNSTAFCLDLSNGKAAGAIADDTEVSTYTGDYPDKESLPEGLKEWLNGFALR
jgi:hypothetical protein